MRIIKHNLAEKASYKNKEKILYTCAHAWIAVLLKSLKDKFKAASLLLMTYIKITYILQFMF